MNKICLTVLCPPALEETFLDALLISPDCDFFTRRAAAVHGVSFGELSQSEQVLGRASAIEVSVICDEDAGLRILDMLQRNFRGVGLRHWSVPVLSTGELA